MSDRPNVLPVNPESIPAELRSVDQWVLWKLEDSEDKWTKVPYQATGKLASSTDPQTWTTFATVARTYKTGRFNGIGFVVGPDDPFVGVDLDHCATDGVLEEWASHRVEDLDSYTELSPSGEGVRVFARGSLPPGRRKTGNVEMYDSGRFLTVTGHRIRGEAVEERTEQLAAFHRETFPPLERKPPAAVATTLEDREILDLVDRAANATKFYECWAGGNGHTADGTPSAGDLSLCSMLAFYTRDPAQIDRLFRTSNRMRDKWNRGDYRERTIDRALELVTETYTPAEHYAIRLPAPKGGTLAELLTEEIEPIRFVVDGLIPEGLTFLAGKPKLGKSWLALSLSLAICAGHKALGHRTSPAEVLYVALEDGKRRLQDRVRILGGHHLGPNLRRFHYRTDWPLLQKGGLQALEEWVVEHPETRLIVIDTYAKVRGDLPGKDRYAEEYQQLGQLQTFATRHRVALLLIHHLRKQGADDWLEQLSGSQAVTGAADTLLGLFRERGQMDATLRLVSREVDEKDLALRFDSGRWESMGDAAIYRQSVERTAVLEALEKLGEASASDISPLIDKTPANVSKMLVALSGEGLVERVRRGVYSLTPPVDSVEPVDPTDPPESTQSTQSTYPVDQEALL